MSEIEVTIRLALPRDIHDLTRLYNAYRDFYGEPSAPERALAYIQDRVANSSDRYFLAAPAFPRGAPALGFTHLIPSTNTLAMRPIWFLEDLYVDPAARTFGVATRLMQYAEEFARSTGAERLTLATAHDNIHAQRLYAKMGYLREEHFWYFHRLLN